jgi:hypothetical protein
MQLHVTNETGYYIFHDIYGFGDSYFTSEARMRLLPNVKTENHTSIAQTHLKPSQQLASTAMDLELSKADHQRPR